jgi:predicted AAA+ superfamily ATPase
MLDNTLDLLLRFNEWWKTGMVRKELKKEQKRDLFFKILDYLKNKQIIAIHGLRRTGKTTLMYQIIDYLLEDGIEPKNILYFSFDEIIAKKSKAIEEILETYSSTILKKEWKNSYIFFDEIQHIENWQAIVKRYYDLYPGLKIVISGSGSLFIKKKSRESLAGRIYEFNLETLKFEEFLKMKEIKFEKITKSPNFNLKELNNLYEKLLLNKKEIITNLNDYILKGGFIETIDEESLYKVHKYIKSSVLDRITFHDIPETFDIKEPSILVNLLKIIAANPGGICEYQNLSNSLKVTRQTISNYISYLEESFLVKITTNFTGSYLAGTRKAKKSYLSDHGIINALQGIEIPDDHTLGRIVENIVVNHLDAKYFWRDGNEEIDVMLIKNEEKIPIEVKYKNEIHEKDLKTMKKAIERSNVKRGMMVTKDLFDLKRKDGILLIPLWLFLLVDVKYYASK